MPTLPNSGPIARRAALDAQRPNVLAVREDGRAPNRGLVVDRYQRTTGLKVPDDPTRPGFPWCACLQFFRLVRAAAALGLAVPSDFYPRAYTPTWKRWAQERGLWIPAAAALADPSLLQPGDMALFWYANLTPAPRIGHIEVFTGALLLDERAGKTGRPVGVHTVGGNTGPDAGATVERNGDGVYKKRRRFGQLGMRGGFARIPF